MDPSVTSTDTGVMPPVYSAEDIIEWTLDEASSMGEIGFSANFPDTAANFSAWRCDLNAPPKPVFDEPALEDDADAFHNDVMRIKTRCELMQKMPALVAEAHSIVDARLLAAGRPKPASDDRELRQKVVKLYELEHPPAPANFVPVLVAQGAFSRLDECLKVKWKLSRIRLALKTILMTYLGQPAFQRTSNGGLRPAKRRDRVGCPLSKPLMPKEGSQEREMEVPSAISR